MGGQSLAYDAAGNRTTHGDHRLVYDALDRLLRVETAAGAPVASYVYDAFGRRIEKQVAGVVEETVWAGWQPIETYRDGALVTRRTYGVGLDEIVRLETDLDGDGSLEQEYVPFYDISGNLALLTDETGQPVERYEYSPFGDRWVVIDSIPPELEQVRVEGDALVLELSEAVRLSTVQNALDDGDITFTLTDPATSATTSFPLVASQPVTEGPLAGRRIVLTPDTSQDPLVAGHTAQLFVPGSALEDSFLQAVSGDLSSTWTWAGAEVLQDTASPTVEQVCVAADGALEIVFSEPIDEAALASVVGLTGVSAVSWTVAADGATVRSSGLGAGSYTLTVSTAALDLAGNGLAAAFSDSFQVTSTSGRQQVYLAQPANQILFASTVGNDHGYHGLVHDGETGYVYARHRYLDPATGRFLSTDPMGYVDGPNPYQYALNNPVTFSDPMGEIAESVWDAASLGVGLYSLQHNLREGNWGMAALDALGVLADGTALALPVVPGGAGMALRSYRGMKALDGLRYADNAVNVGQGLYQAHAEADQGNVGMSAFYLGMSALGVRQVVANPWSLRPVTNRIGSNFGNMEFRYKKETFVDLMSSDEAARYQRYWRQNYSVNYKGAPNTRERLQAAPGTRSVRDQKLSSRGEELYTRETIYDEYGRKIGNNDFSAHGRAHQHTNPHHHANPPTDPRRHSSPRPGLHPETPSRSNR